ncbi:MAG: bifunctional precorrin-2 dehydrogenase/sirohydrochlorin ferrochelatase [Candidatus Omnitrophota bacterium]
MGYYPVLFDLEGKKCVVIGGGNVARRKVRSLLKSEARVCVISPELNPALRRLSKEGEISWIKSDYRKKFLRGAFLVIAATDNKQVNSKVSRDAAAANVLVNVVDSPSESSFIVPAVIRDGDLIVGISTSGQVPYLSRKIKEDIKESIIPRYGKALAALKNARRQLKASCPSFKKRKAILAKLAGKVLIA